MEMVIKRKNGRMVIFIKNKKELYEELEKVIKKIHSYETAEIIAMPIVAGSKDYLEWLKPAITGLPFSASL